MHVTVVSPERAVFDGAADAVVAPAYDGQVGILPGHAPFLALLGTGVLAVRQGSASSRFTIAGGFLQVVGAGGGCASPARGGRPGRGWGGGGGGATRSGLWPIGSKSLDRSRGRP